MQTDYSEIEHTLPDFWWTLLSNNKIAIPSTNVRTHFEILYQKKIFKLSTKHCKDDTVVRSNGLTRTRWVERKYRKYNTVDAIELAMEKKGLVSLEEIELLYEKYEKCHNDLIKPGYALGVVEMVVSYINYHCIRLLQS